MARHLNSNDVKRIIGLIDGWSGKLTWDLLCEKIEEALGCRKTRQTLNANAPIKEAFTHKKERLKNQIVGLKIPASLGIAAQRIQRLEEENARLQKENDRLNIKFLVWQSNAYRHRSLTKDQLDAPLPAVDRDSSE